MHLESLGNSDSAFLDSANMGASFLEEFTVEIFEQSISAVISLSFGILSGQINHGFSPHFG